LILHNFKYDYAVIKHNFNIELNLYADTMIFAWLLKSNQQVGLDKLSFDIFNHTMIAFKDVVKKGETFGSIDVDKACEYASEDAWITKRLYNHQIKSFEDDKNLLNIAKTIEFPFISVLNDMEQNGLKVDTNILQDLQKSTKIKLDNLTNEIYKISGTQFNINSPKQLGVVLFETLNLPTGKKTKTGYSTNEAVLLKL